MDCVAPSMTAAELESFWSKMDRSGECWLWTAAKSEKGYGVFAVHDTELGRYKGYKAHRLAYMLLVGTIPSGLCLLHRCDTPACCRPDHVFMGTRSDNNKDMTHKGRHRCGTSVTPVDDCDYARGAWHHNAKLTDELVRALRNDRREGMSYSQLALKYNVNNSAAQRAVKRCTWRHVA